jgi:hypothetical protein
MGGGGAAPPCSPQTGHRWRAVAIGRGERAPSDGRGGGGRHGPSPAQSQTARTSAVKPNCQRAPKNSPRPGKLAKSLLYRHSCTRLNPVKIVAPSRNDHRIVSRPKGAVSADKKPRREPNSVQLGPVSRALPAAKVVCLWPACVLFFRVRRQRPAQVNVNTPVGAGQGGRAGR